MKLYFDWNIYGYIAITNDCLMRRISSRQDVWRNIFILLWFINFKFMIIGNSHVSMRINFTLNKFIKICRFICIIYVSFECEIYSGFKIFAMKILLSKLNGTIFDGNGRRCCRNLCAFFVRCIKVWLKLGD